MTDYTVKLLENFLIQTKQMSFSNVSLLDKITSHWGVWEAPSVSQIFHGWLLACAFGRFIFALVIFFIARTSISVDASGNKGVVSMHSNGLYQDSSENKDCFSSKEQSRLKSFPRLKFSIKLELAVLISLKVWQWTQVPGKLLQVSASRFCARTQTNSYAQDVLSSSRTHQSDKPPRSCKESTNSAINYEDFYGEKHLFALWFS